jgi:hypothetical protein
MTLINNNRIGKYILYALGEIILVIAGILIALQINNRNELHKNQIKINAILTDVQRDLVTDFEDLNIVIDIYSNKDSLITLALNDSLDAQDYKSNPQYFSLITTYVGFESKDNAYKNLMRNSDILPEDYGTIVHLLDGLYLQSKANVLVLQDQLRNLANTHIKKWSEEYTWYIDLTRGQFNEEALEYMLTDPFYKNALAMYKIYASDNLLRLYKAHQLQSVLAYHEIQAHINSTQPIPESISNYLITLNQAQIQPLLGSYSITPNFAINIFEENDQIMAQATGQQAFQVYAKSKSVLFNPVLGIIMKFETDKNGNAGLTLRQAGRETFFKKVQIAS